MATFDSYRDTEGDSELSRAVSNRSLWAMLALGLAVGCIGVNLFVTRPLVHQLAQMQREIAAVERDMEQLVGVRGEVWETSNLLASLNAQHRQLADANEALKAIRDFRIDVQTEGQLTADSVASLDRLVALQETLLVQKEKNVSAANALADLATLQEGLISAHESTLSAESVLNDLARLKDLAAAQQASLTDAELSLQKLVALNTLAAGQVEGLKASEQGLQGLISVKDRILDNTDDLTGAETAAGDLLALKDQILYQSDDTAVAQEQVVKLTALRNQLVENLDSLPAAFTSLDALLDVKDRLLAQTKNVADAIQTLEILSDFSAEFHDRSLALGGMRQSLVEIALLETTIGKIVTILQPVAQLGNLRRLGDHELREAARVILEQRTTRLSDKSSSEFHLQKPEEAFEVPVETIPSTPVPAPIDLE